MLPLINTCQIEISDQDIRQKNFMLKASWMCKVFRYSPMYMHSNTWYSWPQNTMNLKVCYHVDVFFREVPWVICSYRTNNEKRWKKRA